jgi:hypothetical protein
MKEAWAISVVSEGRAIKPLPVPYGWMRLDSVPIVSSGVRQVSQTFTFEIGGRFRVQPNSSAESEKDRLAAALAQKLTAATTYADCILPYVNSVEFAESDDPNEPVMEVVITFQCEKREFR